MTMVALMSMPISSPLAPEAWLPARAQARYRAAARAAWIAFSARTESAARRSINRDTVGSEAMDPNISGWARSIAMSARQSPPNASVSARSAMTLPDHGSRERPPPLQRRRQVPAQAGDAQRLQQQQPTGLRDETRTRRWTP